MTLSWNISVKQMFSFQKLKFSFSEILLRRKPKRRELELIPDHGFIQIRFGSFEFFYTISFLLNFTRYLFSEIFSRYLLQFFIDEKHYAINVEYWSKTISWKYFIFHEMPLKLHFMKCPERKISVYHSLYNWKYF